MVLRLFAFYLLFVSCKSAQDFAIDHNNFAVSYVKVLGNKLNANPFVLFEMELDKSISNQIKTKNLIFNGQKLALETTDYLKFTATWLPTNASELKNVSYDFVFLVYEISGKTQKVKLPVTKQNPLFQPMLPNTP
jgi:hypothetical protein